MITPDFDDDLADAFAESIGDALADVIRDRGLVPVPAAEACQALVAAIAAMIETAPEGERAALVATAITFIMRESGVSTADVIRRRREEARKLSDALGIGVVDDIGPTKGSA